MNQPYQHYTAASFRVDDSIGFQMRQITGIVSGVIDERMAHGDLTDAQWKPLLMLSQGKCQTAAEMARLACHDTGAITRLIDRIEAKGLLRRVRSQSDRRVVNLELTDEGQQAAGRIPAILAETLNALLDGFSPEEVTVLKSLLQRLLENARKMREERPGC